MALAGEIGRNRHLTRRRIESALDYRRSVGLAGHFVDKVLARHRSRLRSRTRKARA